MKVAVFSDVHGNLVALERFVRATKDEVDAYVCLGDVVDYGPWNDECLEIVRQLPGVTILQGNHERLFQGDEDLKNEPALVQDFFRHSRQFFSRLDLIEGLPSRCHLDRFECLHTIDGRSIYPDTPIEIERNYMVGHTHRQFQVNRSGFVIVNPGSVGQNRKWIDMVDYSILDTDSGAVRGQSIRYDVDLLLSEMRGRRYPEQCIEYYTNKPRRGG